MSVRASVIIPTRNRKDLLRKAIASAMAQDVPVEVIVLDDASTDDTVATIRKEFPNVTVIESPTSRGPCVLRNLGAARATGEFLVTLDDDCEFSAPDTLRQTIALFDHPRIAAVTIPFINVLQHDRRVRTAAPDAGGVWAASTYYGGMVVLRRDVYQRVGGYCERLFMHMEEPDLTTRLLGHGYIVRLGTAPPIAHHESPVRNSLRLHVLGARNNILYAWNNVPMPQLLVHLAGTTALHLKRMLRGGRHWWRVIKGLLQGYAAIPFAGADRRPVSRQVYCLYRRMAKSGPVRLDEIEPTLPPLG